MTVNVTGPDGSQFEFPDDTREDVINGALSQHYGGQQQPPQPDPTAKLSPGVRSIMHAFGEGFSQNYEDKLGLSDESRKWLQEKNVLPKDASDYTNPLKPFMAFNESVILPLAVARDAIWRLPFALYHGAQEAIVEAGEALPDISAQPHHGAIGFGGTVGIGSTRQLARDIVSIPDAFMGSPGSVMPKLARPEPFVKPAPIRPVETKIGDVPQPIDTGIARSVAAKTGLPEVDAVLNSPTTKAVIDNPVVDRSHDVPYMAGGSTPLEDPTVYVDRHVPKEQTAPRVSGPGTVTFDPADPWIVHENVEQHTMELLTKGGMSDAEAYRVAHFEYAEKAEQAWYRAHHIDQAAAENEQLTWLPRIQHENPDNPPPNLYEKPYPHDHVAGAQHEAVTEAPPTPDEIARAREIIAANQEGLRTSGFIAYHGSPALFDKFAGKSVDVTTDQSMAERYRQPRGQTAKGPGNLYQVEVRASQDEFLNLDKPLTEQSMKVQDAANVLQSNLPPTAKTWYHGTNRNFETFDLEKAGSHTGVAHRAIFLSDKPSVAESFANREFNENQAPIGNVRPVLIDVKKVMHVPGDHTVPRGAEGQPGFSWQNYDEAKFEQKINEAHAAGYDAVLFEGVNDGGAIANQLAVLRPELIRSVETAKSPRLGMDLWDSLRDAHGAEAAAKMLQDAGLAGTSRALGTYSVFDPSIANITHVNGQPLLAAAKDLGVVGPERPSIADGKPADAAARATGGGPGQPPPAGGGSGPGGAPPQPNPWRDRFEHFVGKLETAEDVKQLIRDAADDRNEFPAARQGDISLGTIDDVAKAAGFEPGEINVRGLGRQLKNDAEVRVAMQLMLQVTDNVKAAAREVKADGSPENLIKLQESIMRRDLAVEQVVGLRAEWGRVGNVFQEFMRDVKDQEALTQFLKDKGRTPTDLKDIAKAVDELDKIGAAKLLNDARTPDFWDKLHWYWQNQLISGWLTHGKYVEANAAFMLWERGIVTPLAAAIGKIKGGPDRVFGGETIAGLAGSIMSTPTALLTALRSVKTGLKVPLPGETALREAAIARGETVSPIIERNFATGVKRPIEGPIGRVIGIFGDAANAIHTFFRIIGYHGELQAQAYRQAAADGLNPLAGDFWNRQKDAAAAPTEKMMQAAIDSANRGTFIDESGPVAKAFQQFVKRTPGLRWVFPFTHIPLNIMKRTVEVTPLAPLSKEVRADLMGENGGIAQDKAAARMIAGSTVMGWFTMQALDGRITGDPPRDQKERDSWNLQGKQANSILIGDHWVSFARFGPVGNLVNLAGNLGQVIPHLTSDDDDGMTKATWAAAEAAGRLMVDETGMQSLQNLFEAFLDPDRRGAQFAASQVSSFLPASSFLQQTASFNDPSMRIAKTFIDGIRYRIPGERETLLPKRDWSGAPIDNPQYGNIIRQRVVNSNPVDMEMDRLQIHPAPPADRIGTVKLPPKLYDQYQVAAGLITRQVLDNWVKQPNWYDLPEFARQDIFKKSISMARQQAAAMLQAAHPEIIVQGVENQLNRINGNKPTKLKD